MKNSMKIFAVGIAFGTILTAISLYVANWAIHPKTYTVSECYQIGRWGENGEWRWIPKEQGDRYGKCLIRFDGVYMTPDKIHESIKQHKEEEYAAHTESPDEHDL